MNYYPGWNKVAAYVSTDVSSLRQGLFNHPGAARMFTVCVAKMG